MDYRLLLAAILLFTAAGIYLAAKFWVFRQRSRDEIDPMAPIKCNPVADDKKEAEEAWKRITQGIN